MKNLLVTGNVASLAAHLCQRLSRQYHMVVAAYQEPPIAFGKGTETVLLSGDKTLEQVFKAHSFQAMIFLATRGEQLSVIPGEADLLSSALAMAKRHGVDRVLYLSSGELSRPNEAVSERGMLMQAMEQLCASYRQRGLEVVIVRLPCVFGPGEMDTLIGRMLISCARGETAVLPFARDAQMDFISAAEVAQLVYRLLERDGQPEELLMVCGAEALTVRELTALFGLLGASVSQGAGEMGYPPMDGSDFQRSYGFSPSERLSVALDNLYLGVKNLLGKQEGQKNRFRSYLHRHPALVKGTSLLLGYGAMEALQMLQDAGQFPAVDLRLLYVALIGAAHGLQTGLFAIVFASFSIARGYGAQSTDILALLGDWKNWMPFVVMILAGSFTGLARDRGRREMRSAREAVNTLEKRCSFLQDLYKQSLLSKEQQPKQPEEKQERLEQQLAQLRKGQERLEQEWLTLLKREQARWDGRKTAQDDEEEDSSRAKLRAEEAEDPEKARMEHQGEQERLKLALLNKALREEKSRPEHATPSQWQPPNVALKEKDADKKLQSGITEEMRPLQEEDDQEEDDFAFDKQPLAAGKKERGADSHTGLNGTAMRQKEQEPLKPSWADPSTEKDQIILGSPFGKMSPDERRKMLEAMQVRARQTSHGKPRRKR
jgi:nucleoside-diphosphate-sugar epimerase